MVTSLRISLRPGLAVGVALVACAPKPADTAGESTTTGTTTGSTSGSTAEPTTTGTTATTTTGTTTSATSEGTTGTTDSTGTPASTGTTGEPASVCDPQPEEVLARFSIDDDANAWDDLDRVHHCAVASVTQAAQLVIALEGCKLDPADMNEQPVTHTLVLDVAPADPIDLAVGEEVVLHEFVRLIWWSNRYFTLRRPSEELVLGGVNAAVVPGSFEGAPSGFLSPFSLQVVEVCPLEPLPPDQGPDPESGGFIMPQECYQLRREQLRTQFEDGAQVEAMDHSAHTWPDEPYQLLVERAEHREDLGNCSDQTDAWFNVVVLRTAP